MLEHFAVQAPLRGEIHHHNPAILQRLFEPRGRIVNPVDRSFVRKPHGADCGEHDKRRAKTPEDRPSSGPGGDLKRTVNQPEAGGSAKCHYGPPVSRARRVRRRDDKRAKPHAHEIGRRRQHQQPHHLLDQLACRARTGHPVHQRGKDGQCQVRRGHPAADRGERQQRRRRILRGRPRRRGAHKRRGARGGKHRRHDAETERTRQAVVSGVEPVDSLRQTDIEQPAHANRHGGNNQPDQNREHRILEKLVGRRKSADAGNHRPKCQPEGHDAQGHGGPQHETPGWVVRGLRQADDLDGDDRKHAGRQIQQPAAERGHDEKQNQTCPGRRIDQERPAEQIETHPGSGRPGVRRLVIFEQRGIHTVYGLSRANDRQRRLQYNRIRNKAGKFIARLVLDLEFKPLRSRRHLLAHLYGKVKNRLTLVHHEIAVGIVCLYRMGLRKANGFQRQPVCRLQDSNVGRIRFEIADSQRLRRIGVDMKSIVNIHHDGQRHEVARARSVDRPGRAYPDLFLGRYGWICEKKCKRQGNQRRFLHR